jgi:CDP-glycerol glycerophosphotransferase
MRRKANRSLNIICSLKSGFIKLLNSLLYFFPIKKNKIIFISYYGSLYGCNPKYISEYLNINQFKGRFDRVWVFNDINKEIPEGCRVISNGSLKYYYELATSKVIISNFRLTSSFLKKKNQLYVQTWHSSLRLKKIEKDVEDKLPKSYVENAKNDSQKIDLLISGCKKSTEIFRKAFWYDGEILEAGTPRNDVFKFGNHNLVSAVRTKLKIKPIQKIFLYAPTFRNDDDLSVFQLDYDVLLNTLVTKFGGDWIILERFHPHMIGKVSNRDIHLSVLNVTEYDDIQELLFVADLLVTDYSALMFDYLYSEKPCILYAPDYENYIENNRKLYFDIKKLPFDISFNQQELSSRILNFDIDSYSKKITDFNKEIGTFESGNASHAVSNYIVDKLDSSNDK